jgi:hypothetical protein
VNAFCTKFRSVKSARKFSSKPAPDPHDRVGDLLFRGNDAPLPGRVHENQLVDEVVDRLLLENGERTVRIDVTGPAGAEGRDHAIDFGQGDRLASHLRDHAIRLSRDGLRGNGTGLRGT